MEAGVSGPSAGEGERMAEEDRGEGPGAGVADRRGQQDEAVERTDEVSRTTQ